MDPYGPVWDRMVPEDSLGASWGLLGRWRIPKGGVQVLGSGGRGVPASRDSPGKLGILPAAGWYSLGLPPLVCIPMAYSGKVGW